MTGRGYRALPAGGASALLLAAPAALADGHGPGGLYRGFLAFDFKDKEIREGMMVVFHADGTMVMGAEEAHDEPLDENGVVAKNDFEAANLGLWRATEDGGIEFGTEQFRAGSGLCNPVNQHGEGLLPTCSFILTARLAPGVEVRGATCDLGGAAGGLALRTVDGQGPR